MNISFGKPFAEIVRTVGAALIRPAWLCAVVILGMVCKDEAEARPFRPSQIPNGAVFSCSNCHVSSGGGGARNAFGQAVFQAIGGSPAQVPFWNTQFAALDSDGDGFTNGQELGDPDGDGVATPGAPVSNPGLATSRPNSPPDFTSIPLTNAVIGLLYQYSATATDPEGTLLSFIKVTGPAWVTVASSGLVSGTPPEGSVGSFTVTIRARDGGSPVATRNQTYTLAVKASFQGWQALNFTMPAEAALALPDADPDADGLPNLIEYALRLNPRTASIFGFPSPTFNSSDQLTFQIDVRDDDPGLVITAEFSGDLPFANVASTTGTVSDPTAADGLRTHSFADTVSLSAVPRRFARLKFEVSL